MCCARRNTELLLQLCITGDYKVENKNVNTIRCETDKNITACQSSNFIHNSGKTNISQVISTIK